MTTGIHDLPVASRPLESSEWARVTRWRYDRLVAAGFDEGPAAVLAATPGFDLHALLDLVDRGCPPPLAARILAPIDVPLSADAAGEQLP